MREEPTRSLLLLDASTDERRLISAVAARAGWSVMGAADVKVFAVLGAWCGLSILPWLWVVASLAAGIHVLALMTLTHTSLGALWSRGSPTLSLGARRATPYAAFLVAPAAIWLAYLVVTGGLQ